MTLDARWICRQVAAEVIRPLRGEVLRPGMPPEAAVFDGDNEPTTLHLAAYDGEAIVGCVTVVRRPMPAADVLPGAETEALNRKRAAEGFPGELPEALSGELPGEQLRGMAVAADYRGRGVGATMLAEVHRRYVTRDLWCNARIAAAGFYERHGWRCVSGVFDVPTVGPHRRMAWSWRSSPGSS